MESPNQPIPQPPRPRGPLIIIGASARAAAQSALRAGYEPWCIDLFADRDLRAMAPVKKCPREKWPAGVLELLKDAPPGPVLLTGAMENHLHLVRQIAESRELAGSQPDAMAAARDPARLARLRLKTKWHRAAYPQTFSGRWHIGLIAQCMLGWTRRRQWLLKPRRSGGGTGIQRWRPWQPVSSGHVVQRFVTGEPFSAVYAGVDGDCRLIALHYQLIGRREFGASEFQYVGSIGPMILPPYLQQGIIDVGRALSEELHLRGLFGVDFVGIERPWFVEVNPRYTASVELVERSLSIAALRLSPPERHALDTLDQLHGKAVLYAKRRCRVPDLMDGFATETIADVPEIGTLIETGQPICTVFSQGLTTLDCDAGLREMAEKVYTRLVPA